MNLPIFDLFAAAGLMIRMLAGSVMLVFSRAIRATSGRMDVAAPGEKDVCDAV